MIDPAAAAAKWAERTGSASAVKAYKDGVMRVTTSPGVAAAAKIDKYAQGVQDALSSGKTLRAFQGIDLGMWQQNAVNFGAAAIPQGVKKGTPKMNAHLTAFLPWQDAQKKAQAASMPDTTLEQRAEKAKDWVLRMATYQKPTQRQYS